MYVLTTAGIKIRLEQPYKQKTFENRNLGSNCFTINHEIEEANARNPYISDEAVRID